MSKVCNTTLLVYLRFVIEIKIVFKHISYALANLIILDTVINLIFLVQDQCAIFRLNAGRRVKFFLRVLPVSPSFFNTMNISLSCGNWKQMHHPRLAKHFGAISFLKLQFWVKNLNSFDALRHSKWDLVGDIAMSQKRSTA